MALYLLSAMVDNKETFFTISGGSLERIFITRDSLSDSVWKTYGFDNKTLESIDQSIYSNLIDAKIWTNSTDVESASVETSNEGLIWTSDSTAINTAGYAYIEQLLLHSDDTLGNIRVAISFDHRNTWYTRGNGYIADSNKIDVSEYTKCELDDGSDLTSVLLDDDMDTMYTFATKKTRAIDINTTNPYTIRRYSLYLDEESRFPCDIALYAIDPATSTYVKLDGFTVRNGRREITRNIDNKLNSNEYRLLFIFGPDTVDELGNHAEDISFSIKNFQMHGQISGMTWVPCKKEEIDTKGMDKTTFNSLTRYDLEPIFRPTQLDYIVFIPNGVSFQGIDVSLPANTPPEIKDFTASAKKIHGSNVDISFIIDDPELSDCSFEIFVNSKKVTERGCSGVDIASGTKINCTIPNIYFNLIDDKSTTPIEATNDLKIVVNDSFGASTSYIYKIINLDYYPTLVTVIVDNKVYMTIDDKDNDSVKYKVQINGTEIISSSFTNVKYYENFEIKTKYIKPNQNNTMKITLTDSVGGEVEYTYTFWGEYYGLLFTNEAGDILSTDVGDILKILEYPPINMGQTSAPVAFKVWNKSSYPYNGIKVDGPGELYGRDVMVGGVMTHEDGIFVELSLLNSFATSDTSVNIPPLAPDEKMTVYTRVKAPNYDLSPGSFTFSFNGSATYVEPDPTTIV